MATATRVKDNAHWLRVLLLYHLLMLVIQNKKSAVICIQIMSVLNCYETSILVNEIFN